MFCRLFKMFWHDSTWYFICKIATSWLSFQNLPTYWFHIPKPNFCHPFGQIPDWKIQDLDRTSAGRPNQPHTFQSFYVRFTWLLPPPWHPLQRNLHQLSNVCRWSLYHRRDGGRASSSNKRARKVLLGQWIKDKCVKNKMHDILPRTTPIMFLHTRRG